MLFYIGIFVIQIDYLVDKELECYVLGFMIWWKYVVNIVWLGFVDVYCDIMNYFVNIGFVYMGVDFNVVSKFFIY